MEGIPVRVDVNRLPPEPWPSYKLEGLDEATDGPLPAAVQLTCRWDGGSTELLLSAEWWKTKGKYRHLIALRTTVASINREIGWVSVALPLQGGGAGERIPIPAAFNSFARRDEDTAEAPQRPDFSQLKAAVERSGLPRLSPWRMEVCTIRLPEGEVEPSPQEAFQRLIHLALLKLPFFLRGESEGITGKPLLELGDLLPGDGGQLDGASEQPEEGQSGERRGGVGPMPGGVRQYKKTFDTLLGHLQERPYSLDEFRTLLRENYDVTGKSALHSYVSVLLGLGVADLGPLKQLFSTRGMLAHRAIGPAVARSVKADCATSWRRRCCATSPWSPWASIMSRPPTPPATPHTGRP